MRDWIERFVAWWGQRLEEKSTWVGVALMATALGKNLPPEMMDALTFWGPMVATALIAASTKGENK